ncbi:MAG: hypothetical protein ABEK59_05630 [Halobacteria archaeon]
MEQAEGLSRHLDSMTENEEDETVENGMRENEKDDKNKAGTGKGGNGDDGSRN